MIFIYFFQTVDGLAVLISSFVQLEGWSGEPCLPSDTVWQWLGCTGTDPPRVTSIKLAGYGLEGPLPDFSTMQDLETIDMSNNRLNGEIPEFLGKLPALKLLNLENNDFSGDVPSNIKNNKKIKLNINGHDKKKTAMMIGLAVGIPLAMVLIISALLYFLIRKRWKARQELEQGQVENGSANEENVESTSMNAGPLIIPLPHNHEEIELGGNSVAVSFGNANPPSNLAGFNVLNEGNEFSMVPDMDMDELEEMLQRQGSAGPSGRL
ncbi:hypothetical protein LguiB_000900 [Lonicera macranthoides]